MKETMVIRTDGDHRLGLGHIYRSVNIAKELRKNGFKIIFLSKSPCLENIIPREFSIKKITGGTKNLQKIIDEIKPTVLILDKLCVDSDELRILTKNTSVVAIDYIGKNKKMLKNGINMLYHTSGLRGKHSFSGFEFTVLSDSIRKRKLIKISRDVKKILVMQGGTDTHCNIPKIVDLLNKIHEKIQISVVTGPSFKCWKELNESANASSHRIRVFHDIKDIGSIMVKNDMAITGGGMTSLELCHLGIPSVIICGESFENETSSLLEKNGFGVNLGYKKILPKEKIVEVIKELMMNYERRKEMNRIGKVLVDGNGTKRVAKKVMRAIK